MTTAYKQPSLLSDGRLKVYAKFAIDHEIPLTAHHMALAESTNTEGFYGIALRVEMAKFYAITSGRPVIVAKQEGSSYAAYAQACRNEGLEPHSRQMWIVHGMPRGPLG